MRRSLLPPIAAVFLTIPLAAGTSHADTERVRLHCQAASPAQTMLDCVAERDVRRDLSERTHVSVFPTGNLVPVGDAQFQVHELGFYNRAAYGVTDHVELNVGMPIVPVVISAGGRIALTNPESPFRLVVGAGVWMPLEEQDRDDKALQVTATVAYQTDRFNIHATASALKAVSEDDVVLSARSIGFVYKVTDKAAWIGEVLRLGEGDIFGCDDRDCGSDHFDTATLGVKLMGEHFDTDLGLMFPLIKPDDSGPIALPMISTTYRY